MVAALWHYRGTVEDGGFVQEKKLCYTYASKENRLD